MTIHTPVVIGDRVIFTMHSGGGINAINLLTGAIAWEIPTPGEFFAQCRPMVVEGKYVVSNDQGMIYIIDPFSGNVIRKIDWGGEINNGIEYYKGALYLGGDVDFVGYLHGIDFNTGEIFLKMEAITKDCFPNAIFNGRPSVDQETGKMYVLDGIMLHCFQLEPR